MIFSSYEGEADLTARSSLTHTHLSIQPQAKLWYKKKNTKEANLWNETRKLVSHASHCIETYTTFGHNLQLRFWFGLAS